MTKPTPHDHDGRYTLYMRELIERARQGDVTAMPELRTLLDDTPELWQQIGDLAQHVGSAWINLLAGNDLFSQECVQREAERRRNELLGKDPSPIERHGCHRPSIVDRLFAPADRLHRATGRALPCKGGVSGLGWVVGTGVGLGTDCPATTKLASSK